MAAAAQEGPPGSGAIAAGSGATVAAGAAVLAAGGNAVDAALAAMLASPIGEPSLSSIGGGGFLLVRKPDGQAHVLDFFVDTPGLGALPRRPSALVSVDVYYPGTTQTFHLGPASVAVPGCVPGLFEGHAEYGKLPLHDVLRPVIGVVSAGWPWEALQLRVLEVVREIFMVQSTGVEVVASAHPGGRFEMPAYTHMLGLIAEGTIAGGNSAAYVEPLLRTLGPSGGLVTEEDLGHYRVFARAPLTLHRNGSKILTNPAPSFGGPIIVDALSQIDAFDGSPAAWRRAIRSLGRATEYHRRAEPVAPRSQRGTTHISVVDGDGMMASLTVSNGSGSGVWVPELGLHLNNMLGEEDLNPAGFHALPPGLRISSMMSPTVVERSDGTVMALGTGGSERIRSAIYEVLLRVVDLGMTAAESITAPRLHPKRDALQAEPGWPSEVLSELQRDSPINVWDQPEFFFGGVNAVMRRPDGSVQAVGDPRRSGRTAIVTADGTITAAAEPA